jgi:hypothetical protein
LLLLLLLLLPLRRRLYLGLLPLLLLLLLWLLLLLLLQLFHQRHPPLGPSTRLRRGPGVISTAGVPYVCRDRQ